MEPLPLYGGFTATFRFLARSDSLGALRTLSSDAGDVDGWEGESSSLLVSLHSTISQSNSWFLLNSLLLLLPSLTSESDVDNILFIATELGFCFAMYHFENCHVAEGATLKLKPTIKVFNSIKCTIEGESSELTAACIVSSYYQVFIQVSLCFNSLYILW